MAERTVERFKKRTVWFHWIHTTAFVILLITGGILFVPGLGSLAAGGATSTYAEVTGTIALADVPAGAQTLTIGFTPASHDTDKFYMTALWLEYTRSVLT